MSPGPAVRLRVDGRPVLVPRGITVAAALIRARIRAFGAHPVTGAPRGPFCGMGTCHECEVSVDGGVDVRACLEPVRDGMTVRTR